MSRSLSWSVPIKERNRAAVLINLLPRNSANKKQTCGSTCWTKINRDRCWNICYLTSALFFALEHLAWGGETGGEVKVRWRRQRDGDDIQPPRWNENITLSFQHNCVSSHISISKENNSARKAPKNCVKVSGSVKNEMLHLLWWLSIQVFFLVGCSQESTLSYYAV